jgi:hypothetical protein
MKNKIIKIYRSISFVLFFTSILSNNILNAQNFNTKDLETKKLVSGNAPAFYMANFILDYSVSFSVWICWRLFWG